MSSQIDLNDRLMGQAHIARQARQIGKQDRLNGFNRIATQSVHFKAWLKGLDPMIKAEAVEAWEEGWDNPD